MASVSIFKELLGCILMLLLASSGLPAHAVEVQAIQALSGSLLDRNIRPLGPRLDAGMKAPTGEEGQEGKAGQPLTEKETLPQPEAGRSTPAHASLTIRIRHIQVEGATRLTPDEITSVTTPFENTEKTLAELEEGILEPLNRLYREKGFVTASVYIPPQKLTGGVLTVRADEGTVSEIVYEEGRHFQAGAVLPRIDLEPGGNFNLRRLENSLRRINENPDLYLSATLQSGKNPGETRVILRAAHEESPVHISPFADNLGRDMIGNHRLGVTLSNNNVLGLGDTLYSSFSFTGNSWGNASGYELPLGKHGTKLGFNYALNRFDFDQSGFNFQGQGAFYTPYLSQELYRSEKSVLTAELGLGIKNSSLELEGFQLNEDRIRTLTPAISWVHQGDTGRTVIHGEMGIGLNLFNATRGDSLTTSRPGAGSRFLRYTGYAVRAQKLPGNTYGIFRALGQATPSELVSLEQFQIGGASTVRGYQQGRLIGDSGFVVSAEWHVPLGFLPEHLKLLKWQIPLRNQIELVGFTDFGGVFDNTPFTGVNIQSNRVVSRAIIGGAGVGLRANLTRKLAARLDLGIPLVKLAGDKSRRPRLHFGLESRIF